MLLVTLSHFGLGKLVPGIFGVTIFFFISGYIITLLLLAEHDRHGRIDFGRFYARRFLRLMPPLILYVAFGIAALLFMDVPVSVTEVAAALLYFANYYAIWQYFGIPTLHNPFTILWSLAVEEHFYLVYPFVLAYLLKRDKRALLAVIAATCIGVLCWRIYLAYGVGLANLPVKRMYAATDTRIDSIAWGIVFALLTRDAMGSGSRSVRARALLAKLRGPLPMATSALVLAGCLLLRDEEFRQTFRYTLQGAALIPVFAAVLEGRGLLHRVAQFQPLVTVGKFSYSLYLWHWIGVCIADYLVAAHFGPSWQFIAIGISLAGTLSSYYLMEQPFEALRHKLR